MGGRDLVYGVATWKFHCGQERSHDMKSMSRHRLVSRRVATWFGVATWLGAGQEKRCCDPF